MIKPQVALTGEYTYISKLDDAIDRPAPDADDDAVKAFESRWAAYLDGTGEAPLKEGATPTVFHLRHLKASECNKLMRSDANGFDMAAAALIGISGAKPPGFELKVGKDGKSNVGDAPEYLWGVLVEVGGRVLARMAPSPK